MFSLVTSVGSLVTSVVSLVVSSAVTSVVLLSSSGVAGGITGDDDGAYKTKK